MGGGWPAEAAFGSVGGFDPGTSRAQRLRHHREAFVSNVDGVLAMRLSCQEEGSGKGCVRRVVAFSLLLFVVLFRVVSDKSNRN